MGLPIADYKLVGRDELLTHPDIHPWAIMTDDGEVIWRTAANGVTTAMTFANNGTADKSLRAMHRKGFFYDAKIVRRSPIRVRGRTATTSQKGPDMQGRRD